MNSANGAALPAAMLPAQLFLRIEKTNMKVVRYDRLHPTGFTATTCRFKPQMSLMANLREAARDEALLQGAATTEVLVSAPVTIAPLAEFQEEDADEIYAYCFPDEDGMRVFYDVVPKADCVVLFALKEAACRTLETLFGHVHYTSSFTTLVRHFAIKGNTATGRRFFIYMHDRRSDFVGFEGTRLLLVNSFDINGVADVAYYAIDAARQIASSETADNVVASDVFYVVSDEYVSCDETATELRRFVTDVRTINASAEYNRHVAATSPHVPYDLLNLLLETY